MYEFPASSWVCSDHGPRVFFEGTGYLPADTPPALATLRQQELEALRVRGCPSGFPSSRMGDERLSGWQQVCAGWSALHARCPCDAQPASRTRSAHAAALPLLAGG